MNCTLPRGWMERRLSDDDCPRSNAQPVSCDTGWRVSAPWTRRRESPLVSRSGSSMGKSFALCEAFGLTPFRAKPPEAQPRGPLRRAWTTRPPTQLSVAERPSAPCTALRAARCKCRYGRLRAGRISRRRGAEGPRLLQDLTPPPARLPPGNAHTRRGRGQGWGWRMTAAVRHAPAARP